MNIDHMLLHARLAVLECRWALPVALLNPALGTLTN